MDAFGDVSGHFRGLIQHDCEVVVVALVIGDTVAAASCPNKTVRNVKDVDEAKWNRLTDTQKRRMIECLADSAHLEFGYNKFTADQLHGLDAHYLLHQDVEFPPAWDLALTGYAYGEILFEYGVVDEPRTNIYIDKVASKEQTNSVIDHTETFVDLTQTFIADSKGVKGVQAADCFAGAVAEDFKRGTNWLDEFDDSNVVSTTSAALVQLESDLAHYDKNVSRR